MAGLWSTGGGKITFYMKDEKNLKSASSSCVDTPELNKVHDISKKVKRPAQRNSEAVFFLPQRPYMVLGTLRQQLLYPIWAEDAISLSDSTITIGIDLITILWSKIVKFVEIHFPNYIFKVFTDKYIYNCRTHFWFKLSLETSSISSPFIGTKVQYGLFNHWKRYNHFPFDRSKGI